MGKREGFGTTNALIVTEAGVVLGSDSRITSYSDRVLRESRKIARVYREKRANTIESTHIVSSWAGDLYEAHGFLHMLKKAAREFKQRTPDLKVWPAIVATAKRNLARRHYVEGFAGFIISFEAGSLKSWRIFVDIGHDSLCPRDATCKCDLKTYTGIELLKPGIYTLGSGSYPAIEWLNTTCTLDTRCIDEDGEVGFMIPGFNLELVIEEVENLVFSSLHCAATKDSFSGTPFKVVSLRADGSLSTKQKSFLTLHYDSPLTIYEESTTLFFFYRKKFMLNHYGREIPKDLFNMLKKKSVRVPDGLGHPVTWLNGGYVLHMLHTEMWGVVQQVMSLTCLHRPRRVPKFATDYVEGMKYFRYQNRKVYVVPGKKRVIEKLIEKDVWGVKGFRGAA